MINWTSYLCKCDCDEDYTGSYKRHIVLIPPLVIKYNLDDTMIKSKIAVDVCLRNEIEHLWNIGIHTTGACCGHGVQEPYIGVIDDDIQKMKDMGYKISINELDITREDSFYPLGYKII